MSKHKCRKPRWRLGRYRNRPWVCALCGRAWLSHYDIVMFGGEGPDIGAWRWTQWKPWGKRR